MEEGGGKWDGGREKKGKRKRSNLSKNVLYTVGKSLICILKMQTIQCNGKY